MIRYSTTRLAAALAFSTLGATIFACSGADPLGDAASASSGDEDLVVHFPKMYSAHDGEHEFKVPAAVEGVKNVKWSVSDPEVADIERQADGTAMITIRKPGSTKVIAKAGGLQGSATLEVSAAEDGAWEAGNQRYNNGVILKRGEGRRDGGAGPSSDPSRKQASCVNCHATQGQDVEHTPMQTAGYTDAELVAIFTEGTKPEGVPQRVMMNKSAWQRIHRWEMDEFAVKGIVVYLRSLEPKSQGETDFGGFGGRGRGDGDGEGRRARDGGAAE